MNVKVRDNRLSQVEIRSAATVAWGAARAYARAVGLNVRDDAPFGAFVLVAGLHEYPDVDYTSDGAARWLFDVDPHHQTASQQRALAKIFLATAGAIVETIESEIDPAYSQTVSRAPVACCGRADQVRAGGETVGFTCAEHHCQKCQSVNWAKDGSGAEYCWTCKVPRPILAGQSTAGA